MNVNRTEPYPAGPGEPNFFHTKIQGLLVNACTSFFQHFLAQYPQQSKPFRDGPVLRAGMRRKRLAAPVSPFFLSRALLLPGAGERSSAVNRVVRLGLHFSNSSRMFSSGVCLAHSSCQGRSENKPPGRRKRGPATRRGAWPQAEGEAVRGGVWSF